MREWGTKMETHIKGTVYTCNWLPVGVDSASNDNQEAKCRRSALARDGGTDKKVIALLWLVRFLIERQQR